MERFYFEVPSMERKQDAFDYIAEHHEYKSNINGSGALDKYYAMNDYEGWLKKLEDDYHQIPDEKRVPGLTYFLVRESDKKIVGMINLRLTLNDHLKKFGGHIGYGIRPTERGKGYNKINLYLGLKELDKHGVDMVFMDADLDNPASWKTMEALGGVRVNQYFDDEYAHCEVVDYNIDVKKSLAEHSFYEDCIVVEADKKIGSEIC